MSATETEYNGLTNEEIKSFIGEPLNLESLAAEVAELRREVETLKSLAIETASRTSAHAQGFAKY
jgi:hypothetical protein